jgi:hypothetical protein
VIKFFTAETVPQADIYQPAKAVYDCVDISIVLFSVGLYVSAMRATTLKARRNHDAARTSREITNGHHEWELR